MATKGFDAFWAELAPCSHVVQIYEDDSAFMDNLAEFVAGGLAREEAAVVIVTPDHRKGLSARLKVKGFDVVAAAASDQLILLDADETISRFLVNDWPQDILFHGTIGAVLRRAVGPGRKVRAFGEMVALMWAKGLCGATIKLEHLWTDLCRKSDFSLFCAYPKTGFTEDASADIGRLCHLHTATFEADPARSAGSSLSPEGDLRDRAAAFAPR